MEDLNTSGTFPNTTGTLLVSRDMVSIFTNIDNKCDLTAVKKALNAKRKTHFYDHMHRKSCDN